VAKRPFPPSFSHLLQRPALWLAGLALLATVMIVMLAGQPWRVEAENLANNPLSNTGTALVASTVVSSTTNADGGQTATAVSNQTNTIIPPTASSEPVLTATATVQKTAVPSPTATSSPEPASEPTTTVNKSTEITETLQPSATALLSSSLFNTPSVDSQEITFIGVDEVVSVLGRSKTGDWFYVQTEDGQEGFVYGPRLAWSGNFEALQVVTTTAVSSSNPPANSCSGSACPTLTINLYPLPGTRCEETMKYRTVFIQGEGGDGHYTYYWNGQKVAGPMADGFGFEVSSPDGSAVIGTGKVVSGDGQIAELELFVSDFNCN
ncbi:hypothetical protein MNBD_CHLOROFLEXI01-2830, partial [hydrothermal vent metagenome]